MVFVQVANQLITCDVLKLTGCPDAHHVGWFNQTAAIMISQYSDSSACHDSFLWRLMIYGAASFWPIVIICLRWKFGCSLISSGGPVFGILTALCSEMRLHFCQSGTFIFPNSHRAASPLCVGRWPFFQSSPTWLAHQAGQWVAAMYTAITQNPLSMSCN